MHHRHRKKTAEERIAPLGRMHHRHRRKTAEERFNMLARGWLAYPVTQMHALLPPKSGCINVIPRFALSRRRATALFHNPVCKAQRSVPGFSSTPTSACRRYATSPPSAVASPHRPPSSSYCPIGAMHHRHRRKTAEERFHTLARGWLAYPVTPTHHASTTEERLYKRHPLVCKSNDTHKRNHLANNLYNRSSAVDSSFNNQPQVGKPTWGYDYTTVLRRLPHHIVRHPSDCASPSSIIIGLPHRRNTSP